MNLSQVKDGESAVIESVPDGEAGQRLEALGLRGQRTAGDVEDVEYAHGDYP